MQKCDTPPVLYLLISFCPSLNFERFCLETSLKYTIEPSFSLRDLIRTKKIYDHMIAHVHYKYDIILFCILRFRNLKTNKLTELKSNNFAGLHNLVDL